MKALTMKIEKGIPAPANEKPFRGINGRRSKYPFMEMEVGDSVFFPGQENGGAAHSSVIRWQDKAPDGRRFTTREEDGGIRIFGE